MRKERCTVEDLIDDKIELIEDTLIWCEDFIKAHTSFSYDAPPLWGDFGFDNWHEFRSHRNKAFVDFEGEPQDEYPIPMFDIGIPGGMTIMKDDCIDTLKILRRKNLKNMHRTYVKSVFLATDSIIARQHYMCGFFNKGYAKKTNRLQISAARKRENKERSKLEVLDIFQKKFKISDINLISKHKIANMILQNIGPGPYSMSLNKIKYLLEELHEQGKISLPKDK